MTQYTIKADDENNAETFWSMVGDSFPAVEAELRDNGSAVVTEEQWEAIQKIEGFSDGPAHAKHALIANPIYYVLSGEGESGTWEQFSGDLDSKLKEERCDGDRWAKAFTLSDGILHPEEDGYEAMFWNDQISEEAAQ